MPEEKPKEETSSSKLKLVKYDQAAKVAVYKINVPNQALNIFKSADLKLLESHGEYKSTWDTIIVDLSNGTRNSRVSVTLEDSTVVTTYPVRDGTSGNSTSSTNNQRPSQTDYQKPIYPALDLERTVAPNPYFADLVVSIGGTETGEGGMILDGIPPEHIKSFTHVRTMNDQANKMSLELFDESGILLEATLLKAIDDAQATNLDIFFKYGYTESQYSVREWGSNSYPVFKGLMTNMDVEFANGSATISLETMSQVVQTAGEPKIQSFDGKTISQIVQTIAEQESWTIGLIEETAPIPAEQSAQLGEKAQKIFNQQNIPSTKFIKEELMPYAVSAKTGQGGYNLYFVDDPSGPIVYFHPPDYAQEPDQMYKFEVWHDRHDKVISFKPNMSSVTSALIAGAGTAQVTTTDPNSGEAVQSQSEQSEDRAIAGKKAPIDFSKFKTNVYSSSLSKEEADAMVQAMWSKAAALAAYEAEMVIQGNPNLEVGKTIYVTVFSKAGYPHHSSGIYMISEITDTIEMGKYETALKLVKNGAGYGVPQKGVDMSEPKPRS
ncbi:baseplate protein [Bacillus phage vB_BceM-HSE3]|nr:baseplate protein [Bacillus phage vB_BceM-HSE3]